MSELAHALRPLRCRSCGAAVPLGLGDQAPCPGCGELTTIPADYLDLRSLRTLDAGQRDEAQALLRKLDRPASLLTKVVARIFDQPIAVFWLFYAGPIIFGAIVASLIFSKHWARHRGLPPGQEAPWWQVYILASAIVFIFVALPRVIGLYANRRASGRIRLLAALQARPPSIPGCPASCRACGAPLEVVPDEMMARCLYCQCDNVLNVQMPVRGATRPAVEEVGYGLRDAVDLDRQERRVLQEKLRSEMQRYGWRALGFVVPICVWGWDYDRSQKTGAAPGWGLLALVFVTGHLFSLFVRRKGQKDDIIVAADRLSGNDVPAWVGMVGPLAFWVILYLFLRLF